MERSAPYYGRRNQTPVLAELAAFMADPAAREHAIRHRQGECMEAEEFIRNHFLDLDSETIRAGSPHTLLCTKNDRSHQHVLKWRKKDGENLRKLEAR